MTARAKSLTKRATTSRQDGPNQLTAISDTDTGNVIRVFLGGLEHMGFEADSLLAGTGFRRADFEDPDARFPCALTGAILGHAMRTRPVKNLGMKLAVETPMGAFPLLDYLVLSCENVGAAVHQLARYFRVVDAPCTMEILDGEEPIRVYYRGRNSDLAIEFGISLTLLHLHEETLGRFVADYASFTHRPDDTSEMEQVLRCPVRSQASWNGFTFTHQAGEIPMRRRDAILHQVLQRQAAEITSRLPTGDGVAEEVRRTVASRLAQGDLQIETVARELATSARSLQRRLGEVGITYQQLLDDTRREAADTYLTNAKLSIGEVAYLLGYSEPAAFHRAFKRWKGITPQSFREQRKLN